MGVSRIAVSSVHDIPQLKNGSLKVLKTLRETISWIALKATRMKKTFWKFFMVCMLRCPRRRNPFSVRSFGCSEQINMWGTKYAEIYEKNTSGVDWTCFGFTVSSKNEFIWMQADSNILAYIYMERELRYKKDNFENEILIPNSWSSQPPQTSVCG